MNVLDAAMQHKVYYKPSSLTETTKANEVSKPAKKNNKNVKIASAIGSAIGIAGAVGGVYAMAKKGNPNFKFSNLRYEEKDILMIGAGSVLGGLAGGVVSDKDKANRKAKLREASQQLFGNIMCPIGLLALANKGFEKLNFKMPQFASTSKVAQFGNMFLNALPKVAVTLGSLVAGMNIGNTVMTKVNNKLFKEEQNHHVHASDYLVHADDLCIAANLLLKDTKAISSVTSRVLPATFILAGTKTGMQEATQHKH